MKILRFPTVVATLCLFSSFLSNSSLAHATDYVWAGAENGRAADWFSAKNWEADGANAPAVRAGGKRRAATASEPTGVPGPGDSATIGAGVSVAVNQPLTIGELTVEDGGVLLGAGEVSVLSSFTLKGAQLQGTGQVSVAEEATVTLAEGENGTDNLISKVVDNSGNLIWESGEVDMTKDFHNHGVVYLGCDAEINVPENVATQPTFYNDGMVVKAISEGQSRFESNFENDGDIYIRTGLLDLGPSYSQKGGSLNLDGGDAVTGGTFAINGGVVKGTGVLNGSVVNDGGTFKPGHSPGFITIMGNYTQTSNGTLEMEIGGTEPGTQFDQMNVYGAAFLDGELDLIKWNNYTPTAGQNFFLITCYDMSDDFANFTGLYLGNQLHYRITKTSTDYLATVRLDTSAPSFTVTQPTSGTAYNSIGSAKGTASDGGLGSGINKVTCRLYRYATSSYGIGYWAGGTTWTTGYTAASNEKLATGTTNWSLTLPSLANGQYYVKVTVRDNVGNSVQSSNIVFTKVSSGGATAAIKAAPGTNSALLAHLMLPKEEKAP